MKLSKLKINPSNPQTFNDLSKLENSIKEFPKMMNLRPLVYDPKNMQVLGGNKRLICLQNLGFKEIPDNWTQSADELTPEEKKRFIIADNVGFGEWDWDVLESEFSGYNLDEWNLNVPIRIENINKKDFTDSEFIEEFEKIDNTNCELAIVPDFFEDHQCFIIPCHNDIDIKFIRDMFGLNENTIAKSGDKKIRKTNVIDINKLREWTVK